MASPQDVGGRVYAQAENTADFTFTPYQPLAALVTRLVVNNLSANDIIAISTDSKVLWRVPVNTNTHNLVLDDAPQDFALGFNIFDWFKQAMGYQLTFPVAQSFTFEVKSEGGATFNVYLEAMEVLAGAVNPTLINDPRSNHYLLPVFGSIAAAITGVGPTDIDTFVAPKYIPQVFLPGYQPGGYRTQLLALWSDALGVNTFSGSANHQSTTQYLQISKNGQPMYTRASTGIPNVGSPSAAGSANKVNKGLLQRYPAFDFCSDYYKALIVPPLDFSQGDRIDFAYQYEGSFTGGADYSNNLLCGLLDVQYTNS